MDKRTSKESMTVSEDSKHMDSSVSTSSDISERSIDPSITTDNGHPHNKSARYPPYLSSGPKFSGNNLTEYNESDRSTSSEASVLSNQNSLHVHEWKNRFKFSNMYACIPYMRVFNTITLQGKVT